jgi:hypothetical protein
MPAGKGTYGSKVGRPSKKKKIKKMMGGGSSKAAKPMAKSVYKKGGAKKKLPKAQPGDIVGKAAQSIGTGGGGMYDSALKALGLGKKAGSGAGASAFTKAISKLGKAGLKAKEAQQLKDFGLANPDKFPPIPPILSAPIEPIRNMEEANKAAGHDVSGTIIDNFGKGGSVINGKSLRNYSRGGARKNR